MRIYLLSIIFMAISIESSRGTFSEVSPSQNNCLIINWQPFGDYRAAFKQMPNTNLFMIADSSTPNEKIQELTPFLSEIVLIDNFFGSGVLELKVLDLNKRHKITSIIAFDEFDLLRASRLRKTLDLAGGQTYQSALVYRDKFLMKEMLKQKSGLDLPRFSKVDSALDLIDFSKSGYPIVVKPTRGAGAERTYIIRSEEELSNIIGNRFLFGHFHNSNLIAEEFIEGEMYNVNGFVVGGKVAFAWPNKYVNNCLSMLQGKLLANLTLSSDNPMVPRLIKFSNEVLASLPTPANSSFHLELFHTPDDRLVFCEIGSRLCGGLLYVDWMSAFGLDIVNEDLLIQAGITDSWAHRAIPSAPIYISGHVEFPVQQGILLSIPEEVNFPWIKKYKRRLSPGDKISEAKSILDRTAEISFIADTEDQFMTRLRQLELWFSEKTSWGPL